MSTSIIAGAAFAFGALCMILGFFVMVRGIGGENSGGTVKMLGVEISTSHVGQGILFALFGLVLIIFAISKFPAINEDKADAKAAKAAATVAPPPPLGAQPAPTADSPPAQPVVKPPAKDVASSDTDAPPSKGLEEHNREAGLVREVMLHASQGDCEEALLSPSLLMSCRNMVQTFMSFGQVGAVSYEGTQQSPYGPADVFSVQYSRGVIEWKAIMGGDGKFQALWYGYP